MLKRRVSQNTQPICTHKISVQSAKPSHAYPIIRLPREFRRLAGAAATVYETTHNGALAFLVFPHRNRKGNKSDLDTDIEKTSLHTAKAGHSKTPTSTESDCIDFDDRRFRDAAPLARSRPRREGATRATQNE
jgi:hypothetical protein